VKKYLIIANNGPEDPNRATVPFLTAKALVEKNTRFLFGFITTPSILCLRELQKTYRHRACLTLKT